MYIYAKYLCFILLCDRDLLMRLIMMKYIVQVFNYYYYYYVIVLPILSWLISSTNNIHCIEMIFNSFLIDYYPLYPLLIKILYSFHNRYTFTTKVLYSYLTKWYDKYIIIIILLYRDESFYSKQVEYDNIQITPYEIFVKYILHMIDTNSTEYIISYDCLLMIIFILKYSRVSNEIYSIIIPPLYIKLLKYDLTNHNTISRRILQLFQMLIYSNPVISLQIIISNNILDTVYYIHYIII